MDHQKSAKPNDSHKSSHVSEAAEDFLHEGKKLANELYEEGASRVHHAQKSMKECSDELVHKVRENPLISVAIAAGIGFILSSILRK